MIWHIPAESALLQYGGHPRLVGEEEVEVRGQDAVFHVAQHLRNLRIHPGGCQDGKKGIAFLSVFVWVEFGEYVVVLLLQDVDRHVEVVVLHGGGGVDGGERGSHVDHELVVEAAVVEIVADGAHVH